jgi:putative transposon-encoded protein
MVKTKFVVEDSLAHFKKKVTKFGNGAKIDCPKEYLGNKVIVIVEHDS